MRKNKPGYEKIKVSIRANAFKKFPNMSIMFFKITDADNIIHCQQADHLVREAARLIQLTFHKQTIKSHHLISPWVAVQKEFGKHARLYHTSVERLLQKVLRKEKITSSNTMVNILRYLTLRYLVPIGVDDIHKIKGNIIFATAQGHERASLFSRLKAGALFYHDDRGILGTKLDYWKSSRTAVHKDTTSALYHIICLPPVSPPLMRELAREMEDLLSSFCRAKITGVVLNASRRSATIS